MKDFILSNKTRIYLDTRIQTSEKGRQFQLRSTELVDGKIWSNGMYRKASILKYRFLDNMNEGFILNLDHNDNKTSINFFK